MTTAQRIKLMADWWPAACAAQGWRAGDRELRLRALSLCVSREHWTVLEFREAMESAGTDAGAPRLESASDLNTTTDIDAVKRTLGLLAENVAAGTDTAEKGARRRLLNRLSAAAENLGIAHPAEFMAAICRDKFAGQTDVTRLTNGQLQQLVVTLTRAGARRALTKKMEVPF